MYIRLVKLYAIEIPFHFSIDHNLKKRRNSLSIIVEIETNNGLKGYGEGAPRSYVTGENLDHIQAQAFQLYNYLVHRRIQSTVDIKRMSRQIRLATNSSAIQCAVEIALLDVLGKSQDRSITSLIAHKKDFLLAYSGIIPFVNGSNLDRILDVIEKLELTQVKVKVGDQDDLHRLVAVRKRLGDHVDIRIDTNRAWDFDEAVAKLEAFSKIRITGVEEPLKSDQLYLLPKLARITQVPIILDETLCTIHDARYWSQMFTSGQCQFNLKLSKHGGLFATKQIHRIAQERDIKCHLGCNVGVSSIMSAAERIFAQTHELGHLEGSYAPFFMTDDLVESPLCFGKHGLAHLQETSGLGVDVRQSLLQRYGRQLYTSDLQLSTYAVTQ